MIRVATEEGLLVDVESPTQEQQAAYDRVQAKARREALVESIVVEVGDKAFDGDEVSQTRMARAVVAMQAMGVVSIPWTLADNRTVVVSINELVTALAMAGQRQSELWVL